MLRLAFIILALLAAAAKPVLCQTTQPITWVVAGQPDGTQYKFDRSGAPGLLPLPDALQSAVLAATRPAVVTPPETPKDPRGIYLAAGESWSAALRKCPSGKIVYLANGATYNGDRLIDTAGSLAAGISLATPPGTPATIRVPDGSAILLWKARGFGVYNVRFVAEKATKTGLDFVDCNAIALDGLDVSGFRWAIGNDVKANKRSVGFTVSNSKIHDNLFKGGDSHGGWFGSTDGLVVKGCYFESNGDTTSGADVAARCHNLYINGLCGPATITDSYFARSAGPSVQMRSGGDCLRNAFVDSPSHLSFGIVNGDGPIYAGGVSGSIKNNSFVGTRQMGKTWLGYAVELSNVKDVEVSNNAATTDVTVDPKLGSFPYFLKVDVCKLSATNKDKGKEVTVAGRLVIQDNATRWNGLDVWINNSIPKAVASRVTRQTAFPAVDVAAERAKATARSLTAAN